MTRILLTDAEILDLAMSYIARNRFLLHVERRKPEGQIEMIPTPSILTGFAAEIRLAEERATKATQ